MLFPNLASTTSLLATEFCTDIHGPFRMNCNHFAVPVHLAPILGQNVYVSNTLVYESLLAQLRLFQSASATLCFVLLCKC